MVCRWEQEILGHHFTIVHISNNMIVDIYAITQRFWHLISHHIDIDALLISHNCAKHPCAYDAIEFSDLGNIKITETDNLSSEPPPFFTKDIIHQFYQDSTTHSATAF